MFVKNTYVLPQLCQCHIAVQIRCGWCVWRRHLDNIHQSSCKICKSMFPSMVMSCVSYRNMRCLTIQTVIPYTIQPQTPVKASFLNAMVTLSKWSRSGFRTPRSPSFKWVGHQSLATFPRVTFPMGQALQVELEDAESRMRTPSPFDRDPEILHSFPGAGFP